MARKAKNSPDDEAPGPGDNSGETPDALAAVIAECYLGYAELAGERSAINWDIAAHFEKFEGRGIKAKEKKAIKAAYSDAHNADKSSAKDQHAANVRVKLALGHLTLADVNWTKAAKQESLFPDVGAQAEIAYRTAYDEGRKDAATRMLVKSLNPYEPGTRSWEGYNDGWERGAEDRANAGLDAPDRTERKKPGRPKAAAVTPEPETRDPAESPAPTITEAMERSRAHLGGDLPEPPAVIN